MKKGTAICKSDLIKYIKKGEVVTFERIKPGYENFPCIQATRTQPKDDIMINGKNVRYRLSGRIFEKYFRIFEEHEEDCKRLP